MAVENNVSIKSNLELQKTTNTVMLPQRKINPNAVDKTPNKDTLQLSTKKVLIGAIIAKIGVVLGVTLLVLKGKKPPKNIINQAEQTITHPATIPKMEMTDDAKVIYDNIASILQVLV